MQAVILSENEAVTLRLRQVLLHQGHDCPAANLVLPEHAAEHLASLRPELILFVLSPEPEEHLAALQEIRALTRGILLAVGPTVESRLVLSALRAGADDYVDENELETDLPAALARKKLTAVAAGDLGRVIALVAPNGGSGASTLAVNIATTYARTKKSALLVDLKLATGDLAALLDLQPAHTLAEVCQNEARLDRLMFERSLTRHSSGVHLLPPPQTFADMSLVTPAGVRQAMLFARALFSYVIVDLDYSFREEQLEVLRHADVVLVVMRLDFISLRNTRRALDELEKVGVNKERVQLVVNRYGQPKEVPARKAEEALDRKIAHYVPDDPKTVNRANNSGVPVVLESPSARVSKSITRLAASVNGHA